MTQRQHQLSFCEICRNKTFSSKKGIICQLTNDVASFDHTCPEFDEDPTLKRKSELSDEARRIEKTRESTFGLSSFGIKSGTIAGIVYILLGIASIVLTIFVLDFISLWSIVLLIIGIVLIVKSAISMGANKGRIKQHVDLLDDEIKQL